MAVQKLTDKRIRAAAPGKHEDGGGLRLVVDKSGSRRWVLRITINGKRREMGLGGYPSISLADIRGKAEIIRKQVASGIDPFSEAIRITPKRYNFDQCATEFIESKSAEWSNIKHIQQWANTLKTYANPIIGQKAIDRIIIDDVLKIVTPIWQSKTETAKRVQSRIEAVIDYATAKKYRTGDNPARWIHNLDAILPQPNKLKTVRHHPAMPYQEMREFMEELAVNKCMSSLALQFLILTACRTNEALGAEWSEIDLNTRIWTIPAKRMKAGKEHRVPLSYSAIAVLQQVPNLLGNPFIFSSPRAGKHLSEGSLLMLMRGMGHGNNCDKSNYVPHGFRSSFRDWSGEISHYPHDVCEMALAHAIGNKVEAAYRRGDLLEKRKLMMEDWCAYISPINSQ